jgi:hypothetical protein
MANKKITDLVDIGTPASGDLLEIVDVSEGVSKRVTVGNLSNLQINEEGETPISNVNRVEFANATVEDLGSGTVKVTPLGGGDVPTLQEVTDEGNTTTNDIIIDNGTDVLKIELKQEEGIIVSNSGDSSTLLNDNLLVSDSETTITKSQYRKDKVIKNFGTNRVDLIFPTPTGTTGEILFKDVVNETETVAFLSDITGGGDLSSLIKQQFTYTSGAQTFTLTETPSAIYLVFVNGQELNTDQFSIATNVLTIIDTLISGDKVNILYSGQPVGVIPSYTKVETDALLDDKISKHVGATYTTNAIQTVTQAEYDALTPDASTLYFII